uniref:ribosomal protein L29 n=1 Tax=Polyopes affinis TaxID=194519 RepID=UPI002A804EE2|nr:ribosomal protein L29 [Polyopes affinis]WOL37061.1 ribosomal protein L29 [Polyopes affinis]
MSLPKIEELKELSHEDIEKRITELKKDLFDIRFKQATKQSIKPHIFKHKKHELAQLLMLENNYTMNK